MLEGKMAKKSMSVWPKKVATKNDQSRWTKDMLKAEKDDSIARKSTVAATRAWKRCLRSGMGSGSSKNGSSKKGKAKAKAKAKARAKSKSKPVEVEQSDESDE